MALKTGFDGKVIFLNATNGQLRNKKANLYGESYEGVLTGIKLVETEYNKEKGKAVRLYMKDETNKELGIISFNALSWTCQNFFSRLSGINLDLPFTFHTQKAEYNDKVTYVWIEQNGRPVKADPNSVTRRKVTVNGKDVNDWTDLVTHAQAVINELNSTRFKKDETEPSVEKYVPPEDEENIPF